MKENGVFINLEDMTEDDMSEAMAAIQRIYGAKDPEDEQENIDDRFY